ncbi:hypothetical protein BDW22DRAFT_83853 [Trametopsis cervina]|nr:hypothetical protein BDW22DRAFT_83853 [Trametopsis cervina]
MAQRLLQSIWPSRNRHGSIWKRNRSPMYQGLYGQQRTITQVLPGTRQRLWLFILGFVGTLYLLVVFRQRYLTLEQTWLPPFKWVMRPVTLVFGAQDLRAVWKWEVESGHVPGAIDTLPEYLSASDLPQNPARPPTASPGGSEGVGPERVYARPAHAEAKWREQGAYPPRPQQGSAADMDMIMDYCDYSQGKSVRECLKFLRQGGGLDNTTRSFASDCGERCDYIYTLHPRRERPTDIREDVHAVHEETRRWTSGESKLPLPVIRRPSNTDLTCDPDNPRIFHMFWEGAFTDKPYMAILSFLYTQNLGLHFDRAIERPLGACTPQLWLWIHQRAWADTHAPNEWERVMLAELTANEWATPFLHPRFGDVVKFKVWNGEQMLQDTPELHDDWPTKRSHSKRSPASPPALYDTASVAFSDTVRFVLLHKYGGIYLDVDLLFLRDMSELWGYPSAFAYRWSRLPDRYNTAVLRLHRGSALGTWLLRTAHQNGMGFHPIRVSRYVEDAEMRGLLVQAPVALFDPAWLMVEGYEKGRGPQPHLATYGELFRPVQETGAQPEAVGFDGFFKGAYMYHYHNHWYVSRVSQRGSIHEIRSLLCAHRWLPFDPARDFPDLGPRFPSYGHETVRMLPGAGNDLSWSAVLKRTFEAYLRGERPNMYGEWIRW